MTEEDELNERKLLRRELAAQDRERRELELVLAAKEGRINELEERTRELEHEREVVRDSLLKVVGNEFEHKPTTWLAGRVEGMWKDLSEARAAIARVKELAGRLESDGDPMIDYQRQNIEPLRSPVSVLNVSGRRVVELDGKKTIIGGGGSSAEEGADGIPGYYRIHSKSPLEPVDGEPKDWATAKYPPFRYDLKCDICGHSPLKHSAPGNCWRCTECWHGVAFMTTEVPEQRKPPTEDGDEA